MGIRPNPTGGTYCTYDAPPDPSVGWEGLATSPHLPLGAASAHTSFDHRVLRMDKPPRYFVQVGACHYDG